MDYLPLQFDIRGKLCLVVGGGDVAARKVRQLLAAGARVRLVAPRAAASLASVVTQNSGEVLERAYEARDLADAVLVVAATSDEATQVQVHRDARARGTPVNTVDRADLSTVIFPAVIDRSPILVSISTSAHSPFLSSYLRARIEQLIPAGAGRLAHLFAEVREDVKRRLSTLADRRRFWEAAVDGPVAEAVFRGDDVAARAQLRAQLDGSEPTAAVGEVFIVGAGPGDPELLTLKAHRLMQRADVVLYDRLISDEILDMVRKDAARIYVGKHRGDDAISQRDLNARMVALAREGKRVLRLKGGDPFIFGRGGEELTHLLASGVSCQVVPGITAALGCASYCGIPLTHRDHSHSVRLLTAHDPEALDWAAIAGEEGTLAFYMGFARMACVCDALMAHGRSAETPAALVANGTTSDQRLVRGTIGDLTRRAAPLDLAPPVLLIVGDVVGLAEQGPRAPLVRTG